MYSARHAISQTLKLHGYSTSGVEYQNLSSDANRAIHLVTLSDRCRLVAKVAELNHAAPLHAECAGLSGLAASEYLVLPEVCSVNIVGSCAVLVMEYMELCRESGPGAWERFGDALAKHHKASTAELYGWSDDNFIGATPQRNQWSDDWVTFNQERRLGYQLGLATTSGLLGSIEVEHVERVITRLSDFIPRKPPASLLHGDLWSGNAIQTELEGRGVIALIDPAVYHGDPIADIAMMKMFGGFPESCFRGYFGASVEDKQVESRILVYQLYHMLNHLNLFGRGYAGSVLGIAQKLLRL